MTVKGMPARLLIFVLGISACGVVAVSLSWMFDPLRLSGLFILLGVSVILSETVAVRLPNGGTQSISYPLFITILVLNGPTAVAVAACSASVFADARAKKSVERIVFNAGQLALSAVAAGWVFVWVGDSIGLAPSALSSLDVDVFPEVLLPTLLYSIVVFSLNSALVSMAISLSEKEPFLRVWRGSYSWQVVTQFALTLLGLALAKLIILQGWIGMLVFAVPMLVSRGVFQSYVSLREAYADTVRGLVAAIEAKDPYTRGHSERVSEYAVAIADSLGLSSYHIERLELSALLHDLGKIGIGRTVLCKKGRLTETEMGAVRKHPVFAAEIVGSISFLQEAVPAIVHHHERYDGTGYAAGLAGDGIPLDARILAVADSYDAMTSQRSYKSMLTHRDAMRELRVGAGTQFDPDVVAAFESLVLSSSE